jgi:hypothetical protein
MGDGSGFVNVNKLGLKGGRKKGKGETRFQTLKEEEQN